jgi:hypothetical protein
LHEGWHDRIEKFKGKCKIMKIRRGPGRPFQSGNKSGKGRPPGSRNKATLAMQALLDGEGEAIMREVIELAKKGNETALRLCVERLIPPRRELPVRLALPQISSAGDISGAMAAVVSAAAQGEITTGEAVHLSRV